MKFLLFLLGVTTAIISELTLKYSSSEILTNIYIVSIPILLFVSIYYYFIKKFKLTNLVKK